MSRVFFFLCNVIKYKHWRFDWLVCCVKWNACAATYWMMLESTHWPRRWQCKMHALHCDWEWFRFNCFQDRYKDLIRYSTCCIHSMHYSFLKIIHRLLVLNASIQIIAIHVTAIWRLFIYSLVAVRHARVIQFQFELPQVLKWNVCQTKHKLKITNSI